MPHHNRTPKSVLNAPTRTRFVLSDQSDLNRRERRRAYRELDEQGKPVLRLRSKGTIPPVRQLSTRNRPYVKADPLSIVRPRRTVSARMGSAVGRVRSSFAARRSS